jgi:methyl-accepting chemotaxis protein
MEPDVVVVEPTRPGATTFARYAGIVIVVLSAIGLVGGLFVVESLADDARASVSVSQSALQAMNETVETLDEVAVDTSASLAAASRSVGQVSDTVDEAVTALQGVADFLEVGLPETLGAVQMSMPAAIQTADAVDGTLRALSLFGVDYDPAEPFGESLARVNTALASLPDELRAQSAAIRDLIPSTTQLAVESDQLAASMSELEESLEGFVALTDDYEVTLTEAEATIDATSSSIDSSIWTIRALVVGAGLIGIVAGAALTSLAAHIASIQARLDALDVVHEHEVVT